MILSKTDFLILCTINKLVEEGFYYNAGIVRTVPVKISGTDFKPSLLIESDIKDDIER